LIFFELIHDLYALAMAPHPIEYLFFWLSWFAVCFFIGARRRDAQRRNPKNDGRLPGPLPRRWS
jgi:hypothetical protein